MLDSSHTAHVLVKIKCLDLNSVANPSLLRHIEMYHYNS